MLAYDCFLSHDWGKDEDGRDNHARVAKICAGLKAAGLRPWFDEERMQGECKGPAAPCTLSDSVTHTLTRSRVARFCHRVGMFMPPSSALSTLEIKSWQRIQICQAQVIPQTVVCRRRRGADGGAATFFGSLDPSAWSWRQTTVCGPWDKRSSLSSCCGFGITTSKSALVMNPSPFASIRSARAVAVFIVSMPSSSMSMLATSATLSLKTDGRVVNAWHSASRPKHTVTRSIEGRIASCQRGRGGRAAAASWPQLVLRIWKCFTKATKCDTLVPLVIAPRARIHTETNNRRGYE